MGKYGRAAVETVKLLNNDTIDEPEKAWNIVTSQVFGDGSSGQKKGCPKGTFLGLCEEGLIKGVHSGKYTKSVKNKSYALKAVDIIRKTPSISNNPVDIWILIMNGEIKSHNHQMDVVTSLWNEKMIK